jgi:hypothetical protein
MENLLNRPRSTFFATVFESLQGGVPGTAPELGSRNEQEALIYFARQRNTAQPDL